MNKAEHSPEAQISNRGIDVDNTLEHITGIDIDTDLDSVRPVFQNVSRYDDQYWILRWNKPQNFDDDMYEIRRIFDLTANRMGFGYRDIPGSHEAEIEIYEDQEGSLLRKSKYEGSSIRDVKGALYCGFSIEEILEKDHSLNGGPKIIQATDPYRERVYRFETLPDEDFVLAGIEGYSQFNDDDIHVAFGLPINEEIYSYLRSETADYDDWRE